MEPEDTGERNSDNESMSHKKTRSDGRGLPSSFWLWGLCLLLCLWALGLCLSCNPWRDNLTGLVWIDHKWMSAGGFIPFACLFNACLTDRVFRQCEETRLARLSLLFWGIGWIGAWLPWQDVSVNLLWGLLSSLHLFLCPLAFCGILLLWLYAALSWTSSRALRQAAQGMIGIAAGSLALTAFSQSVSLYCELFFLCASPVYLVWKIRTFSRDAGS